MVDFKAPDAVLLRPQITVFGVGGAGGNAVNNMITSNLQGVNFVVANTDAQALSNSLSPNIIQLGETVTGGLGAGALAERGQAAAKESVEAIKAHLEGSHMVFITAGMGGGTGTGASPVIAKIARELGILTVGVVTKPFHFEGIKRMKTAEKGVVDLQNEVDTLVVIPNQNLFRVANENTTFAEAFQMADAVLNAGVRGVTDLIIMPGLINLDFADIKSVMKEMGRAMMGTGEASGEGRAVKAAEAAISNPLLDNSSMKGAKSVLINITGGQDMTLYEVDAAANRIIEEVGDSNANIIFGSAFNSDLKGFIRVSVVATGIGDTIIKFDSINANATRDELDSISDYAPIPETLDTIAPALFENTLPSEKTLENNLDPLPLSAVFDGYNNKENIVHNRENISISEAPQIPNNIVAPVKKAGMFSKVWNSLLSRQDKVQTTNIPLTKSTADYSEVLNSHQPPISNNKAEIHEVPTFFRKPR